MNQVVGLQQVDAVVVPLVRLAHAHVGADHHIALAIPCTGDESIALSTLDAGVFLGIHDSFATKDVLIVHAVAAHCIGCVLATVAHVAIQVAIATLHFVLCKGSAATQQAQSQECHCSSHRNSQLSIFNSQFPIFNSQFPIFNSQFSIFNFSCCHISTELMPFCQRM